MDKTDPRPVFVFYNKEDKTLLESLKKVSDNHDYTTLKISCYEDIKNKSLVLAS